MGPLVICEAVYAELAAGAPDQSSLDEFLASTGILLVVSTIDVWYRAGRAWRAYRSRRPVDPQCPACGETNRVACARCGRPLSFRQHILADFLIGAHALVHADRLLTRDLDYYRTYFPDLALAP